MKITTKLLLLAAFIVLALPLVFTGNASAVVYNPDGLSLNAATGMWELPVFGSAGIAGCYDGTTTINDTATTGPDASRFKCYNLQGTAANALTTASACVAPGVTPAGWTAAVSIGRWSACSKGGYSANTTNSLTDCATNGGTVDAFSRCNRSLAPADCNSTNLPGYTWTSTGTSAATYVCKATFANATDCANYTQTFGSTTVVGSAAVAAGVTTCTVYISDTASCTTAGGTISTANTDETRGYCGPNWVFKSGTAGNFGSSIRNNCTKCHNPIYMASAGTDFEDFEGELVHSVRDAGTVSQYMNASHKNASRKIPPAGFFAPGQGLVNVWLDTNEVEHFGVFPYLPGLNMLQTNSTVSPNHNIRMVDWVNGKIEDTTGGLANLPTGVYTEWYWEFGYYGADPERGVLNMEVNATTGKPLAKQQACFACHATGYVMSSAADATKEPELSFPGISWNGTQTWAAGTRPGVVNLVGAMTNRVTNVKTTSTYGAWDQFGVVCAKCHNAAGGSHTSGGDGQPNPTTGLMVNATCGQCHIRAGSSDWAVTAGTGQLAVRAAVGTGHPNWHGTDFLNSPHARFTGTYGQVATASTYTSEFMGAPNNFAGCVGCHNPHGSVRLFFEELAEINDPHGEDESLGPLKGVETGCVECHNVPRGLAPAITTFRHPTDPNKPTPWATSDPCATCHMQGGRHLFRVTTDVNYTTTAATAVPLKAETGPTGTWDQAVWQDLKGVCQQCHNGHHEGIPFIQTADLRGFANGFHGGAPEPDADWGGVTANFTWALSAPTSKTVNFDATGSCPVGDTCSYRWNFGDDASTAALLVPTTNHLYAANGNYSAQVIVAVTAGPHVGTNRAIAKGITVAATNTPPVAAATMAQSGWTVDVTNTSTDAETATSALGVSIACGNSTTASGTGVGPFTCTYTTQGTYILKMTVTDAGGLKSTINIPATVPVKYSVSGSVMRLNGTTPVPSASVRLMVGTQVVKMASTAANGTFTLTSVSPGSYTLRVVKSGLVFVDQPVVVTNANVTGITVLADR